MSKFIIKGGKPLYGSVRLGGAKNASYKLMIASLLGSSETRLLNFSHIQDVQATREIIDSLGGKTQSAGERTLFIDPTGLKSFTIADKFGPASRSSTMFIPALLHRFKRASVPLPGGDNIGSRPLDRHFDGLQAMGARLEYGQDRVTASSPRLKGITYRFAKNSHTGTETLVMAAVLAQGKTILQNAALEPEVDDLITFLNQMGAHIRRRLGRIIEIEGVDRLTSTIHSIMPDRNEAVSYACAALVTKGDVIVENAQADHLTAFLDKLDEIGGGFEVGTYGLRFFYQGPLKATDVVTKPHPGFMTDWQPLWTILMTQAIGQSIIHETIFPSRFQHAEGLVAFGADVKPTHIDVDNPEKTYNFDLQNGYQAGGHAILVTGPTKFTGGHHQIYDLRSGATMVLAALAASAATTLDRVELIDRGYESLDSRLQSMGADIKRQG